MAAQPCRLVPSCRYKCWRRKDWPAYHRSRGILDGSQFILARSIWYVVWGAACRFERVNDSILSGRLSVGRTAWNFSPSAFVRMDSRCGVPRQHTLVFSRHVQWLDFGPRNWVFPLVVVVRGTRGRTVRSCWTE